jgi:hypothetical protein
MRTGNIVKTAHGDVVIISDVRKDYVSWISATHGNCQGGTQMITTEKDVDCDCLSMCCGQPDFDCPDCHGTGKIKEIKLGMDRATVLADNMFDYIKNRLLKNFDF